MTVTRITVFGKARNFSKVAHWEATLSALKKVKGGFVECEHHERQNLYNAARKLGIRIQTATVCDTLCRPLVRAVILRDR